MSTNAQPEGQPEIAERASLLMFLIVAWIAGVSSAIDRADINMVRSDVTGRESSTMLMDSWQAFWPFILIVGAFYAALVWLIGGWWYRVRLKWSGDANADPFSARIVYIYTDRRCSQGSG